LPSERSICPNDGVAPVPSVVVLTAARDDLADVARYIRRERQSRRVVKAFIDRLIAHCERMAGLSTAIGRARSELRQGFRSVTFGNYVIFFRFRSEGGEDRAIMEIIHVVHGSRDLDAWCRSPPDDPCSAGGRQARTTGAGPASLPAPGSLDTAS